jgi:hypothetical protein
MNVYEKIESLLEELPVKLFWMDTKQGFGMKEFVTYSRYDEMSGAQVDDKEAATTYFFQFDVYSTGDPLTIAERLKEILVSNGFVRRSATSTVEKDEGENLYYREIMRFYYTQTN